MKYNISIESVPGMHKRYEDHYGVKHFNEDVLVVLADGMGSTDCAKEAAELAVKTIINAFDTSTSIPDALLHSIMAANDAIMNTCIARGCKMGCAIAVVYITDKQLWFVSLGNVRIYAHVGTANECITTDDVYVASNGNHFLTRSISGKDLQGKVEVKERSIDGISSISLETDGKYHQDEQDDATVIRIAII